MTGFECDDCMWEARRSVGLPITTSVTPRNLRRQVQEAYEDELYRNHPEARSNER